MREKLLTDLKVKNAKPRVVNGELKENSLSDGGNLFLRVAENGAKFWRFRYKLNGRPRATGLGSYPAVSLELARKLRDEKRRAVLEGRDFVAEKRAVTNEQRKNAERAESDRKNSVEAVARRWFESRRGGWSNVYAKKNIENLERNAFPILGARPIASISRRDMGDLFDSKRAGKAGLAADIPLGEKRKLRQLLSAVFDFALAVDLAQSNPARDAAAYLPPRPKEDKVEHYATITDPSRIGHLLVAIDGFSGSYSVAQALRLLPHLFVRPGELRNAEWAEFHLRGEHPEWRIPGKKMKSTKEHRVPLSRQVVALLKEVHKFSGHERLVLPGLRPNRPLSDNTLNAALRTLGYGSDDIVSHGFRGMASTLLNEQGWPPDVIERQLAHVERDKVRGAYNHAKYMAERRKMMQHWSDFLDSLRANVAKAA